MEPVIDVPGDCLGPINLQGNYEAINNMDLIATIWVGSRKKENFTLSCTM